ncbi:Leucine-rich repeat transmembrane protein FLRT1 [Taenia crassiceps]|uniref:Leucine-rich repeat transmembrane protein FLRT1 n=1 Tax=Taenia crassiceps TaxID=6207 RepID=A0ABR4QKE0_9CEST
MLPRLVLLPLLLMLPVCVNQVHSVKGCVTYVTDDDYNEKASICVRLDTHFTHIPLTLPREVVRLTINHQSIEVLDRRQLEHLPNLTYLDLDSNGLSVIRRDAFLPVPNLRELSLRFNNLTLAVDSFHPNALTSANTLEALNLMRNPIGRVPAHYFYPMRNKLRSLVLAGASPDFYISTEALEGLFKLEVLDISYNNIETLPNTFNGLFTTMQLKQLFLFGNPWRCDCTLRWLREWMDRHNTTQYYIDPRGVDANGYVVDPLLPMEPGSMENVAYPKCASPPRLAGRALFPILTVQNNPIVPSEMACPPRPKRSSFIVRGKVGENITLTCDFDASSVDEVLWYKNGNPIVSASRVRVRQVYHGQVAVELFLSGIQDSDVGTYICLLKNDFGKANTTITLSLADPQWMQGANVEAGFIGWLDQFNSNTVLKYSSIAAVVIVILLITVGTFLYCFCRRPSKNVAKALVNPPHSKSSFTEMAPLNGIHSATTDGGISSRRLQPPRYSPSHDIPFTQHHQPYILSFQDSHPLYSMAEHGTVDVAGSPRFNTLDKGMNAYGGLTTVPVSQIPEMLSTPITSSSVMLMGEPGPGTNAQAADYVLCPRHGSVLASLGSPQGNGSRVDSQLSPVVRTTRTIKLNPFPPPSRNSTTLKTKHVEFADTSNATTVGDTRPEVVLMTVTTAGNEDKSSGFITTV